MMTKVADHASPQEVIAPEGSNIAQFTPLPTPDIVDQEPDDPLEEPPGGGLIVPLIFLEAWRRWRASQEPQPKRQPERTQPDYPDAPADPDAASAIPISTEDGTMVWNKDAGGWMALDDGGSNGIGGSGRGGSGGRPDRPDDSDDNRQRWIEQLITWLNNNPQVANTTLLLIMNEFGALFTRAELVRGYCIYAWYCSRKVGACHGYHE